MPLRDNELARRESGRIELRPEPLRVRWTFDDLVTSDGHDLRCAFVCSVRGLPDATERRMLEEVLMRDRPAVKDEDVAAHFHRPLRAAAAKAAESQKAADPLEEAGKQKLIDALRTAGRGVAFACGVELLPPFHLDAESPTLQQQRLRAMQRTLAEQQAAGQVEHFQRAAELLKQFQALRQSAPELSPGNVLQQIGPADRGSALQTLLLAQSKQEAARALWAVAGPYLVRIDARDGPPRTALFPLPPDLGPLRSVQPADVDGRRVLLVGARSGFMVIRPDEPSDPRIFPDPDVASQLGFSRVIYWGPRNGFCGCHGEAGIVRWSAGNAAAPVGVIRPDRLIPAGVSLDADPSASAAARAAGPRNLQVVDENHLAFSVGSRLFLLDARNEITPLPAESDAEVTAIVPESRQLFVVYEDGAVCVLDRATRQTTCKERRGGRIRSAGALPWLGSTRLLLAADDGPVQCVGYEDQLVTQYVSPHRSLRAVAGSADLVAGVSSDRQRLILWNSWDGRKPAAEIYLAGIAKHRIADVDFG